MSMETISSREFNCLLVSGKLLPQKLDSPYSSLFSSVSKVFLTPKKNQNPNIYNELVWARI